jgi:SNF2 family DNA or RNA helicase
VLFVSLPMRVLLCGLSPNEGKTIQTIVFLGWLKSQHALKSPSSASSLRKAHLIVVPASTLANWQNELARFCPSMQVETYHGSQNERQGKRICMAEKPEEGRFASTFDGLHSAATSYCMLIEEHALLHVAAEALRCTVCIAVCSRW